MFSIENLTDAELEQYVQDQFGQTQEYQELSKKNTLLKQSNSLIKDTEALLKPLNTQQAHLSTEEYDKAIYDGKYALQRANSIANRIRKLLSELGYEEDVFSMREESMRIEGSLMDGDVLHIILPELLPDKVLQGDTGRYAQIASTYSVAFQSFFGEKHFCIYEQKAVICFINFFTKEQELKDHDNFEVKQVIDILSAFLLPDDNPKWCANFMDYRMGEWCHTEIYVVPESKFQNFIKNLYKNRPKKT